jgi:hypothetical protein
MAMLAILALFSAYRIWTSSEGISTDDKVPAVHW